MYHICMFTQIYILLLDIFHNTHPLRDIVHTLFYTAYFFYCFFQYLYLFIKINNSANTYWPLFAYAVSFWSVQCEIDILLPKSVRTRASSFDSIHHCMLVHINWFSPTDYSNVVRKHYENILYLNEN